MGALVRAEKRYLRIRVGLWAAFLVVVAVLGSTARSSLGALNPARAMAALLDRLAAVAAEHEPREFAFEAADAYLATFQHRLHARWPGIVDSMRSDLDRSAPRTLRNSAARLKRTLSEARRLRSEELDRAPPSSLAELTGRDPMLRRRLWSAFERGALRAIGEINQERITRAHAALDMIRAAPPPLDESADMEASTRPMLDGLTRALDRFVSRYADPGHPLETDP